MRPPRFRFPGRPSIGPAALLVGLLFLTSLAGPGGPYAGLSAQVATDQAARVQRIEFAPGDVDMVELNRVAVEVGKEITIRVVPRDAAGAEVDAAVRVVGSRRALEVEPVSDRVWTIRGLEPGEHEVVATLVLPADAGVDPPSASLTVEVSWPPVERVEIGRADEGRRYDETLYEGTRIRYRATALHADGSARPGAVVTWRSSDPAVASVDRHGWVEAHAAGTVTISATFEGATGQERVQARPFPTQRLTIESDVDEIRTGDVVTFDPVALDGSGRRVRDLPVLWSYSYAAPPEIVAPKATAQVDDGIFVADVPGVYTVIATSGPLTATHTFEVMERDVVQELEVVGHGREDRVRTTDFWVFEGVDGRDYALTGSKLAGGYTFAWDVTDPTNIFKTDSVLVDARTVNDVKVSPDGRYATVTREGASNRRDYALLLDLSDPAHPTIAAELAEGITGGVHNAFATNDYAYVLSNGDKYVIFDVSDIHSPKKVGEYDHPDSRLHDVWVHDGIAFSAEWDNGLVAVDVGNGRWGGTPENPVLISTITVPGGATHAAFPYISESNGKFYVFIGDEIMRRDGLAWAGPQCAGSYTLPYDPETGENGCPLATRGYIQVIDFSDPENPEMVARYEVPEYGTHNIWVEDDKLYQAYYEGGLRVVDVSGELRGNLYTQGREVAVYKSFDPGGYVPNSPMVWSAMPHKGWVFFSDTNSGLWAVRLLPKGRPIS